MTMTRNEVTSTQRKMAWASFIIGSLIAIVCIFFIPPLGEIATTSISIVSEFLILAGSLLGIVVSFDTKLEKFRNEMRHRIEENEGI